MTTTAVIAEAACALCGLPCREAAEATAAGASFCCAGCRNVYAILSESGLVQAGVDLRETEIFRRSLELGLVAAPGPVAAATGPTGDPNRVVKELSFGLSGLWCTSCAWLIEHAVRRLPGVVDIGVSFSSDMATVTYAPVEIAPDRIRAAVERLGYGTRPAAEAAERRRREGQDALLRLGLAAFCWLNVMMLNMAVYVGYFERLPDSVARLMPFLLMVLSAPAVFYSAWPILRLAGHGLVTGLIRTETLLALGILCAWGYSVVAAVTRGPHVYFDTACAIVTLVLLGKWIERNARERARAAVTRLYSLLPNKARLYHEGHERFVAIDALRPGDEFLVKAGERIPADGRVIDGVSHVDESMLTGEATPIQRGVGAVVAAGSINGGGVLRVRALRAAGESQIARIVALVEHALAARSTVERVADRFTRIFVPAVLVLAATTWGVSTGVFHLPAAEATMRAIAVLVIACPCALGIAAPLAITAAVGAASREGILIGDSSVLETVNRVDVLVLDKTGTVTDGVVTLIEEPGAELAAIAALEAHSEHPIGRAVVARARELGLRCPPVSDVEILGGRGIRGRVDGVPLSIGSRELVGEVDPALAARAAAHEAGGVSVAFYGRDGRAEGLLALGSRIRPGAVELVARVKERGIRTVLLSGDSPGATAWAAREIAADEARGGVRPEEKARAVASLRRDGRIVAMVGDGVNDAPALAAADLGIAMGSGTDVAINAAAVTLTCNALPRVLDVFRLSERTLRIVRQNLFWAFAYNVAGISLAATGTLHPIVAAGAMVVSSLCVILNSTRLNRLSAAR